MHSISTIPAWEKEIHFAMFQSTFQIHNIQYRHTKNYCNRNPACVKYAEKHLTVNCPNIGKINEVKCFNCNGNHPASYKDWVVRKQLQRTLFPPLRDRTYNNLQAQQDSTKSETTPNSQHAMNTNHSNTNTFGSRSYAQVISQSPPSDNQYRNTLATTLQKSRNCSNNPSKIPKC